MVMSMFLHAYNVDGVLAADPGSSDSWFIVFKVLMLNVTMLTMFFHLSKLGLGSVEPQQNILLVYPYEGWCSLDILFGLSWP